MDNGTQLDPHTSSAVLIEQDHSISLFQICLLHLA